MDGMFVGLYVGANVVGSAVGISVVVGDGVDKYVSHVLSGAIFEHCFNGG